MRWPDGEQTTKNKNENVCASGGKNEDTRGGDAPTHEKGKERRALRGRRGGGGECVPLSWWSGGADSGEEGEEAVRANPHRRFLGGNKEGGEGVDGVLHSETVAMPQATGRGKEEKKEEEGEVRESTLGKGKDERWEGKRLLKGAFHLFPVRMQVRESEGKRSCDGEKK